MLGKPSNLDFVFWSLGLEVDGHRLKGTFMDTCVKLFREFFHTNPFISCYEELV
jgi:hypothetical protein